MGTRLVASVESPVHAAYKEAIVTASPGGTILTPQPPRANKRILRTPFSERLSAASQSIGPIFDVIQSLYVDGDVINSAGSAGEIVGLIHEIKSAADIVTDTMRGFWKEVDRVAALRRVSVG